MLERACRAAGLWGLDQELQFPIIAKSGTNEAGRTIRYYFNYSDKPVSLSYSHGEGIELLTDQAIRTQDEIKLERWEFCYCGGKRRIEAGEKCRQHVWLGAV